MRGKQLVQAVAAAIALGACASPALAYGRVDLVVHPPHARVWVDGAPAGGVPEAIDLPAGPHHVKLTAPGWHTREFSVRVADGKNLRRHVSLTPAGTPHTARPRRHRRPPAVASRPTATVHESAATHPPDRHPAPVHHPAPAAKPAHPTPAHMPPLASAVDPLPLPAPALAPATSSRPDPARLAPPPRALPAVPAPAPATLAMPVGPPAPAARFAGFDGRSWRDLGLFALFAGFMGLLAVRVWRPGLQPALAGWHERRGKRGPLPAEPDEAWTVPVADAIRHGDWSGAVARLWARLNAHGGTAWAYFHLGLAYEQLGREAEAEAAYRAALLGEPAFEAAAFNLAVLLERQGQGPQAAIAYRKLLEAHPDHPDALYNLGHLYRELGMPRQAQVHWRAARQLVPRDAALKRDLGRLERTLRQPRAAARSPAA